MKTPTLTHARLSLFLLLVSLLVPTSYARHHYSAEECEQCMNHYTFYCTESTGDIDLKCLHDVKKEDCYEFCQR